MKKVKMLLAVLMIVSVLSAMVGCSSSPCENCGDTPTKGFKNDSTGEKEYYCADCSSECYLCSDDADKHYTGGAGIIFVCNDCYDELKEYGWVD